MASYEQRFTAWRESSATDPLDAIVDEAIAELRDFGPSYYADLQILRNAVHDALDELQDALAEADRDLAEE